MIKSMTAFGRGKIEGADKDITVEIKSVNSRYFDATVKLPRSYMFLEERIKGYVQKTAVSRAKVDIFLTVDAHDGSAGAVDLDLAYAQSYVQALRTLRDSLGLADDISVMTVARNSEIFRTVRPELDLEAEWERIRPVLDLAIADYHSMRCAEGARIEGDIKAKLEQVRALAARVGELSEADTLGYRDKLEARLRGILRDSSISVDENRLLTECAVFADKIAVDEELVRLGSHFGAFYEICASDEPAGRKLDFLMQEMNRETNTIGSKANNASVARIVVDIKGELEKIREQIQNIE